MKQTARLHVGSVEEMGKRFGDAWRRLERGDKVRETHLTFFDLETMMATLTPKRLALLKHVRLGRDNHPVRSAILLDAVHHPPKSAFTLSRNTHPDYDHDERTQFIDIKERRQAQKRQDVCLKPSFPQGPGVAAALASNSLKSFGTLLLSSILRNTA
jgi:hypothetical protein